MKEYVYSVLRRFFLFQFFLVFAYYKLVDISKSSYEFKDRFYELSKYFNYRNPKVDQLFANPVPLFYGFIVCQLVFTIVAILGRRIFSFFSGILLLVTSVIYYSPFRLRQGGKSGKFLLESFSMEFMMSIALVLAIFAHSLKGSCDKVSTDKASVITDQEKDQITNTETTGRDSRPQSGKGKKKHI